jgi:hypothetical protein
MPAIASIWATIAASALLVPLLGAPTEQPALAIALSQSASTASAPPAIAGGDCTKILDPTAIAVSLTKKKSVVTHWGDPLLFSVGGIDCSYFVGPVGEYVAAVFLKIAPAAVADRGAVERSLSPFACSSDTNGAQSTSGCNATATVGGWWYSLSVGGPAKTQKAAFGKIVSNLEKVLTATSAPTQIDPVEPFNCSAVDTGGLSVTTRRTPPSAWPATDVMGAEIQTASFLVAGATTCTFTLANGKAWHVTVYPGGEPLFYRCGHFSTVDDYPGPSSVISIPGVPTAYGKVATNDGPLLCATDGTSLVSVSGDYDLVLNTKALKTLGSILVPVLAAAD